MYSVFEVRNTFKNPDLNRHMCVCTRKQKAWWNSFSLRGAVFLFSVSLLLVLISLYRTDKNDPLMDWTDALFLENPKQIYMLFKYRQNIYKRTFWILLTTPSICYSSCSYSCPAPAIEKMTWLLFVLSQGYSKHGSAFHSISIFSFFNFLPDLAKVISPPCPIHFHTCTFDFILFSFPPLISPLFLYLDISLDHPIMNSVLNELTWVLSLALKHYQRRLFLVN